MIMRIWSSIVCTLNNIITIDGRSNTRIVLKFVNTFSVTRQLISTPTVGDISGSVPKTIQSLRIHPKGLQNSKLSVVERTGMQDC